MKDVDIELWRNLTMPCEQNDLKDILIGLNQVINNTEHYINYDCEAYEYEGHDNIIKEWNLVCDQQYLVPTIELCFLAGTAIGSISSGWVSDRYGRRHTLMVLLLLQAIFGMYSMSSVNDFV